MSPTLMLPVVLIELLIGVAIIIGALKMMRLQSYGWATTAAILALLPCSPASLLSLAMGIWSLVVLNRRQVKEGFQAQARSRAALRSGTFVRTFFQRKRKETMTEKERYQTARKQVREQKYFWIHLAVFLVVSTGLITLNLVKQPDKLWFHWVLMGWGAGILVHGFKAFGGKNWEESKIKEFVKRDEGWGKDVGND